METIKFRKKYPLEPIRYLGWKQPFASLMLHDKVETRVWDTKYRGWVLITASKNGYSHNDLLKISGHYQLLRINQLISNQNLPYGTAIAIGKLVLSEQMGHYPGQEETIEDKCFVKYNPDLWMHTYEDVQAIEPFEMKGAQGWVKLSEEIIDQINIINP